MAFWCYMLRCADDRFYVGHTDDLERRLGQHGNGGFCDFTACRQPVMLVWSETFPTRLEALEAERRIKGWSRAKKMALIAGDWARLHELARSRAARASTSLSTNGEEDAGYGIEGPLRATIRPELVEGRAASVLIGEETP